MRRWGIRLSDHLPRWEAPAGAQPGICVAGCALRLVAPTDDMAPGGRLGAMRSGVALGLSPAGRPPPALTVEGRSVVSALDRIGQMRCRVGTQK